MPKALTDEGGDAERVFMKLPRGLKDRLKSVLQPGETISSVVRGLIAAEIERRGKGKKKR